MQRPFLEGENMVAWKQTQISMASDCSLVAVLPEGNRPAAAVYEEKGKIHPTKSFPYTGGDTQIVSDIHMLVKYTPRYAFLKELQKCLFQPP